VLTGLSPETTQRSPFMTGQIILFVIGLIRASSFSMPGNPTLEAEMMGQLIDGMCGAFMRQGNRAADSIGDRR
jgi:hypothetical protein